MIITDFPTSNIFLLFYSASETDRCSQGRAHWVAQGDTSDTCRVHCSNSLIQKIIFRDLYRALQKWYDFIQQYLLIMILVQGIVANTRDLCQNFLNAFRSD